MPANYDLKLDKNASFVFYLKYRDEDGNPIDMNGFSADMEIVRFYDAEEHVLSFRSTPQGVTVGNTWSGTSGGLSGGIRLNASFTGARHIDGGSAPTGGIYISLDQKSTRGLTVGDYLYDLVLNNGSTGSTKLLEGRFTVKGSAT